MLSDGDGLHLLVKPGGSKLRGSATGSAARQTCSTGSVPCRFARRCPQQRTTVREQIAAGIDPSIRKRLDKMETTTGAANTFGSIADEHLANLAKQGIARATLDKRRKDTGFPQARKPKGK
jgi:hypothetical protein